MAFHGGLSSSTLASQEVPPQSAAANVNGSGADMQGWDGVAFYIAIGAITGGGTYSAFLDRAVDSAFTAPANIAGANLSAACTTPNTLTVLEAWRPSQRFVRCRLVLLVAASLVSVVSHRYRRGGLLPPTQSASQRVIVMEN